MTILISSVVFTKWIQVNFLHNYFRGRELISVIGQYDTSLGRRQTTDISWWPKPAAWEISGLNVGFWSKDCEAWYQKHLDDIRAGTAELRSPSKWRHSLRLTKACRDVAKHNDELAAQFRRD
jgi:hypothetical protein